jgi:hypothetical protein
MYVSGLEEPGSETHFEVRRQYPAFGDKRYVFGEKLL